MTTLSAPAPKSKAARPLTAELERTADGGSTLTIDGTAYDLVTYQAEAPEVGRVFHLEKRDGTAYDVSEHPHGPECDCPDYECRHRGIHGAFCKHIRSLRAVGLLDAAPTPRQGVQDGRQDVPAVEPSQPSTAAPEPASDDEGDPETWPAWTSADRWELGPDPADAESDPADADFELEPLAGPVPAAPKSYDLAGWLDAQAELYNILGTQAGEMLGRHIAELAGLVRTLNALTPGDFAARCEALDATR